MLRLAVTASYQETMESMFRISNCLALSQSDPIRIRFSVYRGVRLLEIKKTGEERTSQLARFRSKAFCQNPRLLCSRDKSGISRCQRKRRNNLSLSVDGRYHYCGDFECFLMFGCV
ncbi:hypothetical protein NPIL_243651 [Nephila pilipes]|uniref:Uncharacterized protein n=1 Tax=Nephila pilipes TaxID=299642 RepID=A0A8X6UES1_NEPPI|nr:hypothetical protein NPIL_243651 [Nephila pilipes]